LDERSEFLSFVLEKRIREFLDSKPFGFFMIERFSLFGLKAITWKYRYKDKEKTCGQNDEQKERGLK